MKITVEQIAQVAHEINKAFCESIGDLSQPTWDEAPEWQKNSAINGVQFHIANPAAKPSDSHDNWLKEKVAEGWVYGEVKDPVKKEHPCCVPYEQLPVEQRSKDYLFKQVVHSMMKLSDVKKNKSSKEKISKRLGLRWSIEDDHHETFDEKIKDIVEDCLDERDDYEMEKEIVEKGLTYPRVEKSTIDALMDKVIYKCHVVEGTTTTVVTAILPITDHISFTLATVIMACVDPRNFNKELGEKYGIKKARKQAADKLWELEGYHLAKLLASENI